MDISKQVELLQKIVNLTLFTAVLIGSVALANSDENKKVSCEILSCLNSEQRPSKCIRSLKYFYSIKKIICLYI